MLQIPFPRPFLKTYTIAALVTGLSIVFILTVFQPFGTEDFRHPYKTLILSGYGVVAALAIYIYYYLSIHYFNKSREDRWTIVHESVDLFCSMMSGLLLCYIYFTYIFGYTLTFEGMLAFLSRAGSVSLLPVLGTFLYLYNQYGGLRRSTIAFDESPSGTTADHCITLRGTNKDDIIHTSEGEIVYIKAEDNYVILYMDSPDEGIQRHMIRSTMKRILHQLDLDTFYQCHRSYIINRRRLISITGNKNEARAELKSSRRKVPISRSKVDEMKSYLSATH